VAYKEEAMLYRIWHGMLMADRLLGYWRQTAMHLSADGSMLTVVFSRVNRDAKLFHSNEAGHAG
jgi:hypothetical protein